MIQTASCVVEFEAPEDATPEQLQELAYEADTPSLCHLCSDRRNASLEIAGEWSLAVDHRTGKPEIYVDEDGAR
ncbi:hypothetical protein ACFC0S_17115 [Streptomyces sp. NPDC056084]|uniref:hypothetical protein n=1 Tax=unclassified Streptomyces TaxID=2593676 RepID=UPI0035D70FB0